MSIFGLIHFFLFPGLLFAVPASWFYVWGERKAVARMQRRIGPPLLQPFYDFVKLTGKRTPSRHGIEADLLRLWPAISVLSMIGAIAMLPVFPGGRGFSGDAVLLVALLELPSICFILAGFTSGSIYGEIGAIREAVLSVANNLVFLLSIVTIAVTEKTFSLTDMAGGSWNPGHWIGVFGILLCIPAKLRLNPFSTSSAEQEIYSGPLTEYAGAALAMWELAHGLEWVALTGFVTTLVVPVAGPWWFHAVFFVVVSFAQVLLLSTVAAATARFTLQRAIRFYWRWAAILAVLDVSAAIYMRYRG
ncbi:MAG: NADH-quinone oxidoreductase subunit H [Terracidiphilus sp.]|nr:NADH-quinone oxidoreductase subunit H [Terracidiphilus sp.]